MAGFSGDVFELRRVTTLKAAVGLRSDAAARRESNDALLLCVRQSCISNGCTRNKRVLVRAEV